MWDQSTALERSTTGLVSKQKAAGHQVGRHRGLEEKTAASTSFCLTSSLMQTKAEKSYLLLLYTSSRMKVSSSDASAAIPNPLPRDCSLISTCYPACCFPSLIETISNNAPTAPVLSSAALQTPLPTEITTESNFTWSNFTDRQFHDAP